MVLSGVKMQWTKIREKDPLHFDECKEMRVAMTLFTVFFVALWPLLFYFASPHELIKLLILSGFSFVVMAGCIYIVIWPKVYIGYFDPDQNTLQTDAYKNTGTGAEKMTEKEEELFLKCSMLEDTIVRKDKRIDDLEVKKTQIEGLAKTIKEHSVSMDMELEALDESSDEEMSSSSSSSSSSGSDDDEEEEDSDDERSQALRERVSAAKQDSAGAAVTPAGIVQEDGAGGGEDGATAGGDPAGQAVVPLDAPGDGDVAEHGGEREPTRAGDTETPADETRDEQERDVAGGSEKGGKEEGAEEKENEEEEAKGEGKVEKRTDREEGESTEGKPVARKNEQRKQEEEEEEDEQEDQRQEQQKDEEQQSNRHQIVNLHMTEDLRKDLSKRTLREHLEEFLHKTEAITHQLEDQIIELKAQLISKDNVIDRKDDHVSRLKSELKSVKKEKKREKKRMERARNKAHAALKKQLPGLSDFLKRHKLSQYTDMFRDRNVTMNDLVMMPKKEITLFGLKKGHQRRLLAALKALASRSKVYSSSSSSSSSASSSSPLRGAGAVAGAGAASVASTGAAGEESAGQWGSRVDPNSGRTYYYNAVTGETSWSPPEGFALQLGGAGGEEGAARGEEEETAGGTENFVAEGGEDDRAKASESESGEEQREQEEAEAEAEGGAGEEEPIVVAAQDGRGEGAEEGKAPAVPEV